MGFNDFDKTDERIQLIKDIAKISIVTRNYIESGKYIDDAPDPDEETITIEMVFPNIVNILVGELQQLGISFTEEISAMTGDLYRVGVLCAVRRVFDGDLFCEFLKQLPESVRQSMEASVQTVLDGDTDPNFLIQQLIDIVYNSQTISTDWNLLADEVDLFTSSKRLADHLNRVFARFIPSAGVSEQVLLKIQEYLPRYTIQKTRFGIALNVLNSKHELFMDSEIQVLSRDYNCDEVKLITSIGIPKEDALKHRQNTPYYFEYYQSKRLPIDRKACMLIASAISASVVQSAIPQRLMNLSQAYKLTREVSKYLELLISEIPDLSKVHPLPEEHNT